MCESVLLLTGVNIYADLNVIGVAGLCMFDNRLETPRFQQNADVSTKPLTHQPSTTVETFSLVAMVICTASLETEAQTWGELLWSVRGTDIMLVMVSRQTRCGHPLARC